MKPENVEIAMHEALREGRLRPVGSGVYHLTECDLYGLVRRLMHKLAAGSGIPRKWAFSAVAGAMGKLIEHRRCP
jgi:hypothetical protein